MAGWAAAGWFSLVVVGDAAAWALSLPLISSDPWTPTPVQSVFHVQWFLTAAVLAVFIWRAARLSRLLGVLSVVVTSIQVVCIADEGARRLNDAGVVTAVTDLLYLAAGLQVLLFVCVTASGIRRNLADRRWARLVRQLAAMDPAERIHER